MNSNRRTKVLAGSVVAWACAFVGGSVLAGCSGVDDGSSASEVGQVRQALTLEKVCVLAQSSVLRIGDRSVVQGPAAGRTLDVGVDARLNGSTLVDGSGVLRDRARLTGDITLGGFLTLGNGAVVTDFVRQRAPITLPRLFTQAVPAGEDPVSIGPGANTRLFNGGYGDVVIRSRSTVRLSGTYDVTSFAVEADAVLLEDPPGSGIQINSVGSISFGFEGFGSGGGQRLFGRIAGLHRQSVVDRGYRRRADRHRHRRLAIASKRLRGGR